MKRILILALGLSWLGFAGGSSADEIADKGRAVLKNHQHAVVTVQVVAKASTAGRANENRQEITGTVVDPSGLTVLALSACDPTEMYRRLSDDYKVEIEVSDIKILLNDSTELPAEIVLRDKDLDLAFIRPKAKLTNAMPCVNLSHSGTAQVLDPVVTLNRLNRAANRAYAISSERISAVVERPRTFYIPDSNMSSTTLGSPAFLLDGRFLGIFVMRAVRTGGSTANLRQNLTSIILPADEIAKAAQQAPPAKGDEEKKDEAKAGETPAAP